MSSYNNGEFMWIELPACDTRRGAATRRGNRFSEARFRLLFSFVTIQVDEHSPQIAQMDTDEYIHTPSPVSASQCG
jgi:hypothetical protein